MKPYTNMYAMRGETHRTKTLELVTRQRTALCNPIFAGWHNLEMLAVPTKDRYQQYESVPAFWRNWEASRILCVLSLSTPLYDYSLFGENAKRFIYLQLETAITELTIVFFVCFSQTVEYGTDDLFLPARLQSTAKVCHARANIRVLASLPCKMRASNPKHGGLRIVSDCAVDPVSAIFAFARAGEIDGTPLDCLGWFPYDFADATIIFVSEW